MDELIAKFHQTTLFHFHLNGDEGVVTESLIANNTFIGEITGEPMYIWDICHHDYIVVDQDYVLDVSNEMQTNIFSFIRDENATGKVANCKMYSECDHYTGTTRFFLKSTREIQIGEELIYYVDCW